MTTPEDRLREAADTISQMSNTELERKLSEFRRARDARSPVDVYRHQAELDSLDGDPAFYELAGQAEAAGDLRWAAHWYQLAASNDFSDAAFRLAKVLDALAEQLLHRPASQQSAREEEDLFTQACRWYSDAYGAGEIEAADLLEELLARHFAHPETRLALFVADDVDPGQPSAQPPVAPLRPVDRGPQSPRPGPRPTADHRPAQPGRPCETS